jgi:fucose permease
LLASAGLSVFSFTSAPLLAMIGFGIVGFGLSMMRGPLVKVISENMEVKYARLSCTFLSFVSFAGPLLVGLVALFLDWHGVFVFSAFFTLALAVLVFALLTLFERRGLIRPIEATRTKTRQKGGFWRVFKLKNFVIYIFIGMIVETLAISLDQWLMTFLTEHLSLSDGAAEGVYYAISVLRALCPFISLLFFKLFHGQDLLLIRVAYSVTAALLLTLFFAPGSYVGVVLLALALMCASIASSTMWSIYIPSLGKSGKVSSVNGILDSFGYAGASVMNMAFALINTNFGGEGLVIAWAVLPAVGVILTLFGSRTPAEE